MMSTELLSVLDVNCSSCGATLDVSEVVCDAALLWRGVVGEGECVSAQWHGVGGVECVFPLLLPRPCILSHTCIVSVIF